jgi:phosphoglycerate-specific signal transduction histidine kinase
MKGTADDPEGNFYDMVVYELRRPLASINAQVQLARRSLETDPSRAVEALDQVVIQIARMNMLLGELRDRARDAADVDALFKG